MAQLDFAMLAEFARLDPSGLLTVVGGGFDRVQVSAPGLVNQMFLVMRFKLEDDERSASYEVKVIPPGDAPPFRMTLTGTAETPADAQFIPGNLAATSVIGLGIPLETSGTFRVQVLMNGEVAREVRFAVDIADQATD